MANEYIMTSTSSYSTILINLLFSNSFDRDVVTMANKNE